jgi:uncharacterized protein (TIGR03435 family)
MTRSILLTLLAMAASHAQSPSFEVAIIKVSPAPDGQGMSVGCSGGPGTKDPGLLTCENVTLALLMPSAFNINYDQIEAPDWLTQTRFNIVARVPAGATKEQVAQMWQQLFAERFKLMAHRESKTIAKYDLIAGKDGPKFKPAGNEPPAPVADTHQHSQQKVDSEGFPELAKPGMIGMNGRIRLYQTHMTMAQLARTISGQLGRPVIDSTGLRGEYEIRLFWVSEQATNDGTAGPTILRAVQDQLGLHLQPGRGPIEFLVIDHVEKTPTEN